MIDNKLNAVLAMGTPGHLTWFFTYCLLRREVVRDQLEATAPLMHVLEGHWLFDWPHAFKKILAMGSDAMCAQARQSLPQEQAHLMQQNCRWIPAHLPQLHGPDAVFITTGVLGKVSKYTNPVPQGHRDFRRGIELHSGAPCANGSSSSCIPTSLADVGFADIGLDSGFEDCHA